MSAPVRIASLDAVAAAAAEAPVKILMLADWKPGSVVVSGTLSPDASGMLLQLPEGVTPLNTWKGKRAWSSDGNSVIPVSGTWVRLVTVYLETPVAKTIEEIFPAASYLAGTTSSNSSKFQVSGPSPTPVVTYFLLENGGSPKWVKSGDLTLADQGATTIPQGGYIGLIENRLTDAIFIGGLGETWETTEGMDFVHYRADQGFSPDDFPR